MVERLEIFSRLPDDTREMLLLKYESKHFEYIYKAVEYKKQRAVKRLKANTGDIYSTPDNKPTKKKNTR